MVEGHLVKFEDVKMKVLEYFFHHEGWVDEGEIRDFIFTQFKHERLNFWFQLSLSVLESDLLTESDNITYSKNWKLRDTCATIGDIEGNGI